MKQFHGSHKSHSFFEGWYLKHQTANTSISFIPAFHLDEIGESSLSIQIITPDYQGRVLFPAEQFSVDHDEFGVQIGQNHFSHNGIDVNIKTTDFSVRGSLTYGRLTPPSSDIMGPFRHIPFLQCNHGLLSLTHKLYGKLEINGTLVDFSQGSGYIEKDWGNSFPQSYLWTHAGFYAPSGAPCSVMLSVAHIPFMGTHFTGCICSILYEGQEYRLATYHRISILQYTPTFVELRQGKYHLTVELIEADSRPLFAPQNGNMTRTILESISCPVHYRFTAGEWVLFDVTVPNASFESGTEA